MSKLVVNCVLSLATLGVCAIVNNAILKACDKVCPETPNVGNYRNKKEYIETTARLVED